MRIIIGSMEQTSSSSARNWCPNRYSCNRARCNSYRSLTTCRSRRLPLLPRLRPHRRIRYRNIRCHSIRIRHHTRYHSY